MSETCENLKSILRKTADGLDTGNTILNEEEMSFLVDTISEVTSPDISTYTALNMSTLSKSQFYKLISDGILPKGYHVQGYNEIRFNKVRMEEALRKIGKLKSYRK